MTGGGCVSLYPPLASGESVSECVFHKYVTMGAIKDINGHGSRRSSVVGVERRVLQHVRASRPVVFLPPPSTPRSRPHLCLLLVILLTLVDVHPSTATVDTIPTNTFDVASAAAKRRSPLLALEDSIRMQCF